MQYGINESTARDYMRLYRDSNCLPAKYGTTKKTMLPAKPRDSKKQDISDYESMSRDELIALLMETQKRENRLRKMRIGDLYESVTQR